MFYAQLNDKNICIGVSDLSGEVNAPDVIAIDEYDISLLGKQYQDGEWLEVEQEQAAMPAPVTNEEIAEQNLIIMSAFADLASLILGGGTNG